MKRETIIVGFFYVIISGLLIVFSPDALSMLFVIVQAFLLLLGYIFGIFKVSRYSRSFQIARRTLHSVKKDIPSSDLWVPISRHDNLFQYDELNKVFADYKKDVADSKKEDGDLLPDIEVFINEDVLSIKSWRNVVNQIPETLTGIGILGTFVGLVIGVGGIGFSSVAAAITSLQTLINGLEVAFYTSIVGIILSIFFNLTYKFCWNSMLRDMFLFIDDFHKELIPSEEDQLKKLEVKYYTTMIKAYSNEEEA